MGTMSSVVSKVINELRQVPGVATQTYSAGVIQQYVENTFLMLLEETWWNDLMHYFTATVNGTTGHLTADLVGPISNITDFHDIAYVWPENSNRHLNTLPTLTNPFTITGTLATYFTADSTYPNRPLKIWPVTCADNLVIWARQRPVTPIALTDNLYIDDLALMYGAAWMYCVDDGTVPAQVDKFLNMYASRKKILLSNMVANSMPLDTSTVENTSTWW